MDNKVNRKDFINKTIISKHRWLWLLIGFFWISRLPYIGGDYSLAESDEAHYQIIVDQIIANKGWPIYKNNLYLEQFPLFHLLAAIIQKPFSNFGPFIGERFLAMCGAFTIGLALYWFEGWRACLVFWLIPLSMFYSRSGTLDMFALGWVTWAIVLFLNKRQMNWKWMILVGWLLGMGIWAKTAMSIYALFFVGFLIIDKFKTLKQIILVVLIPAFMIGASIVLLYLFFGHSYLIALTQMPKTHLLPVLNLRVHLAIMQIYLQKTTRFLSPWGTSITLYSLLKKYPFYIWWWLIIGLIFMAIFDYWPRYFLLIIPPLALMIGRSLKSLNHLITCLVFIGLIVSVYPSWQGGNHLSLRLVKQQITHLQTKYPNIPVYTTLDPYKFGNYLKQDINWLSPMATISGIAITEEQQGPLMINLTESPFPEMKQIMNYLSTKKPDIIITDPLNHFPENSQKNIFKLYIFPPALTPAIQATPQ